LNVSLISKATCECPRCPNSVLLHAQEAFNNIVKHSRAPRGLRSCQLGGNVTLSISDDGRGFDAEQVPQPRLAWHHRERANAIGALLKCKRSRSRHDRYDDVVCTETENKRGSRASRQNPLYDR
jgi:signal transduction histidine kinase